mgnify:FL=1|tara:strand:- start:446 stop:1564 length:1119 start_codon:yes stop_codon:yes gene_type:complete
MPGHYEMSFGERGRGGGVSRSPSRDPARTERDFQRQQRDAERAANTADRIATTLAAQQTISNMESTLNDMAIRDDARRRLKDIQDREMLALEVAAFQRAIDAKRAADVREELRAREAAMGGAPNLGFGFGYMPPAVDPATAFRAQEAARSMGMNQRQAGFDAYQAMLSDAAAAARANIAGASEGLLGAPTRFMNERFLEGLGSRMGGRDSEAYQLYLSDPNLFSPVYDTTGRLTGYRDERGRLTGRDPIAEEEERRMRQGDGEPEITGTVTDPVTGQEKCPDGYVFDEDLQACRLKPMERTTVDTTPGERFVRSGLLDVAPEGLMGFQERYGAGFGSPMDFASANRAFRMGGAVTPSFFSTPPKLDGYTLLA